MSGRTDDELMAAVKAGEQEALGALFDRHYDELFAFASRMLGDPHAAADAVQEGFLRLIKYRDSYEGQSSFRSWMLRVLRNVCLTFVDECKRRDEAAAILPPPDPVAPPSMPDPRIALLRTALDELSPSRREVLVLRRFHGLSYAEIARLCGISEGAARVTAHRALKQLASVLTSAETHHG